MGDYDPNYKPDWDKWLQKIKSGDNDSYDIDYLEVGDVLVYLENWNDNLLTQIHIPCSDITLYFNVNNSMCIEVDNGDSTFGVSVYVTSIPKIIDKLGESHVRMIEHIGNIGSDIMKLQILTIC